MELKKHRPTQCESRCFSDVFGRTELLVENNRVALTWPQLLLPQSGVLIRGDTRLHLHKVGCVDLVGCRIWLFRRC